MTKTADTGYRDSLLMRIRAPQAQGLERPAGTPLDWDDIGYLSHGLVLGNRPMLNAVRPITERYSLGPRGGWMLNLIAGGIVHPHELSELLGISRSLVTAELIRLTDAGLVESKTGTKDRRRSELTLSDAGKAALKEIRDELFRLLTTALKDYSPEQIRMMGQMLQALRDSVMTSPD